MPPARRQGPPCFQEQLRHLIGSVLWPAFGEELGVRLGIARTPAATALMPLITQLNRQARYWQTHPAASAHEARRRALEEARPELKTAVPA